RRARIVDRHDLIEGGFAVACKTDRSFRRYRVRATAHVGNDDLIAEPVHLGEGCLGGHNYRGSVFLWLWSIKPMGQLASIWRKSPQIASTRDRLRKVAARMFVQDRRQYRRNCGLPVPVSRLLS